MTLNEVGVSTGLQRSVGGKFETADTENALEGDIGLKGKWFSAAESNLTLKK